MELLDCPVGGLVPNPCPLMITVGAAVSPVKRIPLMTVPPEPPVLPPEPPVMFPPPVFPLVLSGDALTTGVVLEEGEGVPLHRRGNVQPDDRQIRGRLAGEGPTAVPGLMIPWLRATVRWSAGLAAAG